MMTEWMFIVLALCLFVYAYEPGVGLGRSGWKLCMLGAAAVAAMVVAGAMAFTLLGDFLLELIPETWRTVIVLALLFLSGVYLLASSLYGGRKDPYACPVNVTCAGWPMALRLGLYLTALTSVLSFVYGLNGSTWVSALILSAVSLLGVITGNLMGRLGARRLLPFLRALPGMMLMTIALVMLSELGLI